VRINNGTRGDMFGNKVNELICNMNIPCIWAENGCAPPVLIDSIPRVVGRKRWKDHGVSWQTVNDMVGKLAGVSNTKPLIQLHSNCVLHSDTPNRYKTLLMIRKFYEGADESHKRNTKAMACFCWTLGLSKLP